ncbi:programmed cell death protein 2 [Chlamydoabsidia padenii]|nr:programmed cell death protein 2 [Chlamydoabsidia padenii]
MSPQKKPNDPTSSTLLGVPDGTISTDDDTDPYLTKLGGLPVWLNDKTPPSDYCKCHVCGGWLYLLCQSYIPLPDSVYHRVIYILACNRRSCMRKEGSFSVIRSHMVDEEYLRAQQQKEEQKKKREEQKKASPGFGTPQGFQLGDLWGGSKSFGSSTTSGFGMTAKPATETLAERLGKLQIDKKEEHKPKLSTEPPVTTSDLPSFPAEYLYITPENTENTKELEFDMSRYQEYLDLESVDDNDTDGTWANEQYEKDQLPRGVDKQFKKFMDRVACEPSQCIRYEWDGLPLFYQYAEGNQGGSCDACGGPRVYEMQLMPNVLSILPTAEYAAATDTPLSTTKTLEGMNVGMEFGTVLVYVCKNDCHPGDTHDTTFVKESAVVQYELD